MGRAKARPLFRLWLRRRPASLVVAWWRPLVGVVDPGAVVGTAVHAPVGLGGEPALAVGDLVVGLAVLGGDVAAARVLAVPVTGDQCSAERAGEEPFPNSHVDDLGRAAEHDALDVGIEQPRDHLRR